MSNVICAQQGPRDWNPSAPVAVISITGRVVTSQGSSALLPSLLAVTSVRSVLLAVLSKTSMVHVIRRFNYVYDFITL